MNIKSANSIIEICLSKFLFTYCTAKSSFPYKVFCRHFPYTLLGYKPGKQLQQIPLLSINREVQKEIFSSCDS